MLSSPTDAVLARESHALLPAALEALCDPSVAMASVFAVVVAGPSLAVVAICGGEGGGGGGADSPARAAAQRLYLYDFTAAGGSEDESGSPPALSRGAFASKDDPVAVALEKGKVLGVFAGESGVLVHCDGGLHALAISRAEPWCSSLVTKVPAGVEEMCVDTATDDGSVVAACLCSAGGGGEGDDEVGELEIYPPPPSYLSLFVAALSVPWAAAAGAAAGTTEWRCACSRVPTPVEGLVLSADAGVAVFRGLLGE